MARLNPDVNFQTGDNQMAVIEMEKPQTINAKDLAAIVRAIRDERGWSQDTLSAISKLSLRTVQRVENAEASNGDTRRALALAFELADADFFNKPMNLPSPEQIQAANAQGWRWTVELTLPRKEFMWGGYQTRISTLSLHNNLTSC
jgi:transcriptional regulator with XRE-family HTH domain